MTKTAVILCGGKGTRLGAIGKKAPKTLLNVKGKPIIWFILNNLIKYKFNKIILPLGYKGEEIKKYVEKNFDFHGIDIIFKKTGLNSQITKRIKLIQNLINDDSFLLINGDCISNCNIQNLINEHYKKKYDITLTSFPYISPYGLIRIRQNKIISFCKDQYFESINLIGDEKALINGGITIINKVCLSKFKMNINEDFEISLFSKLAKQNRAHVIKYRYFWFTVESEKDIKFLINKKNENHIILKKISKLKYDLLKIRQNFKKKKL